MPRVLTIYMPDGRAEYWFTGRVFAVGDKLDRNGETWIVASVGETNDNGTAKHISVTVRHNGDSQQPSEAQPAEELGEFSRG